MASVGQIKKCAHSFDRSMWFKVLSSLLRLCHHITVFILYTETWFSSIECHFERQMRFIYLVIWREFKWMHKLLAICLYNWFVKINVFEFYMLEGECKWTETLYGSWMTRSSVESSILPIQLGNFWIWLLYLSSQSIAVLYLKCFRKVKAHCINLLRDRYTQRN